MKANAKALSLLLVEDDQDTASLVQETLQDHFGPGCVRHCTTIAQAMGLEPTEYDLVLSDMNLPDGTGLELISRMLARRPDLPVVLVTGEGIVENAMQAIRQGAYDYIVKAGDYLFAIPLMVEKNLAIWRTKQENLVLQEQLTRTLEEVRVKNQQLEAAVQQLNAMASTDPLTGLANRRAIAHSLLQCYNEAEESGQDLACVMIDLDGFKLLNDTLGHQRGDELLETAARVLQINSRKTDFVGRFGGDEFIVLLPATDRDTAALVANRIAAEFRTAARKVLPNDPMGEKITMSMGLACLLVSRPGQPEQLMAQADQALYRAKQMGRNRLVVFSPDMPRVAPAA